MYERAKQSFTVVENLDEDDQEWHVQELILIDRSMGKLVLFIEKIDMMIQRNERLIFKNQTLLRAQIAARKIGTIEETLKQQRNQVITLNTKLSTLRKQVKEEYNEAKKREEDTAQTKEEGYQIRSQEIMIDLRCIDRKQEELKRIKGSLQYKYKKMKEEKEQLQ